MKMSILTSMQIVSYVTSFLYLLIGIGLTVALFKNLRLSRWMPVALLGVLMILSVWVLDFALLPMMSRSAGTNAYYRMMMLRTVSRLVATGCFVVGISGTLFDVRSRLMVASAMINDRGSHADVIAQKRS